MTGLLYFSPGNIPALLADTLVSVDVPQSERLIIPSAVVSDPTGIRCAHFVRLTRKIYFLDPRTAVAAAGPEHLIKDYLTEMRELLPHLGERPTRRLSEEANVRPGIEVIGSHFYGDRHMLASYHFGPRSKFFTLPYVNHCHAVGTGANDLAANVQSYLYSIANLSPSAHVPRELIRAIANALNGQKLLAELTHFGGLESRWGGFLEHAYFDTDTLSWTFGKACAHLFFFCFDLPNDRFTMGQATFVYLYRHLGATAVLCCLKMRPFASYEWVMDSVLDEKPEASPGLDGFLSRWSGWQPSSVTFTFQLVTSPTHQSAISSRSTTVEEVKHINFDIGSTEVGYSISEELTQKLRFEIATTYRKRFVGLDELTQADRAALQPYDLPL